MQQASSQAGGGQGVTTVIRIKNNTLGELRMEEPIPVWRRHLHSGLRSSQFSAQAESKPGRLSKKSFAASTAAIGPALHARGSPNSPIRLLSGAPTRTKLHRPVSQST